MTTWICDGCGLEHPETTEPPPLNGCVFDRGPLTIEERGDIGPHTGRWLTHAELAEQPHQLARRDHHRGVHSLRRDPPFGIPHWSFLAQTPHGNLLWDPPNYLDEEILDMVRQLGGVAVIATSHPHTFAAQVSWSHAFGRAPVLVHAASAEWLPRPDPVITYWDDHLEPLPGIELIHVGGHMRGSAVARTSDGTLLTGDTVTGTLLPDWVSFQRNFPKHIPFSPALVRRIVQRLDHYDYDRIYTLGGDTIDDDAKHVVHRSAESHIRWVNGEFDHLT